MNEIGLVFQTREREKSLGELGVMNNCLWMRVAHYFLLQAFLRSSSEVIGLSFQISVFNVNSEESFITFSMFVDFNSVCASNPFKKESKASNLDCDNSFFKIIYYIFTYNFSTSNVIFSLI